MSLPPTAISTEPLVVVLTEVDGEEEAHIDGRPIEAAVGESAREAALRLVMAGPPRDVDIHTPSGVVLHTHVAHQRVDVLGQTLPDERHTARTTDATDVSDASDAKTSGDGHRAARDEGSPPPGFEDDAFWAERDLPWPVTDTTGPSASARRRPRLRPFRRHRRQSAPRSSNNLVTTPLPTTPLPTTPPPATPLDTPPQQPQQPQQPTPRPRRSRLRPQRPARPARLRVTSSRSWLPVLALILVGLLVTGVVARVLLPANPPPVSTIAGGTFPGAPPPGWSPEARWVSPDLLTDTPVAVVSPGAATEGVAVVTADRVIAVVEPHTGATRWSEALADGDVKAGPEATVLNGVPAVALHVGDRAWVRAADDGRVLADARLPEEAELVTVGPAPFVRAGSRAGLLDGRHVEWLDLPDGSSPLAARTDGVLLAGGPEGWWHLRPGDSHAPATGWEQWGSPATRPASAPVVVGALGHSVLVVHPDTSPPRLVVHEDGPVVRASFQSAYLPGRSPTWAPSPSGTWGILGRTLVDLHTGAATDLGDWQTVLVAEEHAYGLVDAELVLARPGHEPEPVQVQTSLIEATTAAGGLARVHTAGAHTVWMLPEAPDPAP